MGAVISTDGVYRYHLTRQWVLTKDFKTMLFVMLNPSTADAEKDDPTIRRCIKFAQDNGCSDLAVVNLFAYRATDPDVMWKAASPSFGIDIVGADNFKHIRKAAKKAHKIVCAWGALAKNKAPDQMYQTINALKGDGPEPRKLWCLGTCKDGSPKHPLYLSEVTQLQRYRP